jgi:hypothetical protein
MEIGGDGDRGKRSTLGRHLLVAPRPFSQSASLFSRCRDRLAFFNYVFNCAGHVEGLLR